MKAPFSKDAFMKAMDNHARELYWVAVIAYLTGLAIGLWGVER